MKHNKVKVNVPNSKTTEEISKDLFNCSYSELDPLIRIQIQKKLIESAGKLIEAKVVSSNKKILQEASQFVRNENMLDKTYESLGSNMFGNNPNNNKLF